MSIEQTNDQNQPDACTAGTSDRQSPTASCCRGGKSLRWVFLAVLLVIGAIAITDNFISSREPDTPAVVWGSDYQQALIQAKDQNKPVLLAFHASWCPPCKEMKRSTYHDQAVIDAAKQFIPVMIDYDTQKDLVLKYEVNSIPAYRVLKPDGTLARAFVGYQSADEFVQALQNAL